MNAPVRISVITVCLNAVDIIDLTIQSVLSQDYQNFEYIIIDGKSSDGTLDIINKYSNRVKVISEHDKGIYDAMNKGIKLSKGDVLYFINAGDEFINTNTLSNVATLALGHPQSQIIYGDIGFQNNPDPWITNIRTYAGEIKSLKYLFTNMFCQQRAFFKRDIFNKVGLFDTSYKIIADYDIIFRAYQMGLPFVYFTQSIAKIPLGGYSNIHVGKFIKERFKHLCFLPWWKRYWIIYHLWGALQRGNLQKFFKLINKTR